MKAITITIDEELDARAAIEARRRGLSKSELIRRGLRQLLPEDPAGQTTEDPWAALSGFGAPDVTVKPGDIDETVYGS